MESSEMLNTDFYGNKCNSCHRDELEQREEVVVLLSRAECIQVPCIIDSKLDLGKVLGDSTGNQK